MADQDTFDNSPRSRRILQTTCDLARRPLDQSRILDLGCAHGIYALELANRGATTLGMEGRASWVEQANASKAALGLSNAEFIQADARTLSAEKHGAFDIVLCLGLLYHLGAEDALNLLQSIFDVCSDFAVIDTQIALVGKETYEWNQHKYHGWTYREHAQDATPEDKTNTLGASLDDEFSFWFTKASLLNALRHVGFTSVFECQNPLDNMYVNGDFKVHADYVTLVAVKGTPLGRFIGISPHDRGEADHPEDMSPFHLERPWSWAAEASVAAPTTPETLEPAPPRPSLLTKMRNALTGA